MEKRGISVRGHPERTSQVREEGGGHPKGDKVKQPYCDNVIIVALLVLLFGVVHFQFKHKMVLYTIS